MSKLTKPWRVVMTHWNTTETTDDSRRTSRFKTIATACMTEPYFRARQTWFRYGRILLLLLLGLIVLQPCHGNEESDALTSMHWVRHWNAIAIDASGLDHTPVTPQENRTFGEHLGPGRASRAMAIVHIAIFDAVNAIIGGY